MSLPITAKIEAMEKVARIFKSFAEADAADAKEDLHISPEKRIEMLLELQERFFGNATQQRFARVYRITQLRQN